MLKNYDKCACPCYFILSWAQEIIFLLLKWISNNPFRTAPIFMAMLFFGFMCCVTFIHPRIETYAVLASSFGSIFAAIKYKLDEASYNKDLFEKRYEVFSVIEEVLWDYFHPEKTVDLSSSGYVMKWKLSLANKIDAVWRKSYFLFGKETEKFIKDFRTSIIDGTLYGPTLGESFYSKE